MPIPRYFVRFMCMRMDASFDIHEDSFYSEAEIRDWAERHSYRDFLTGVLVEWKPIFVYDREEKKDITSKFQQTQCLFYYIIIIEK